MNMLKVGVLAFQGAFSEHEQALEKAFQTMNNTETDSELSLQITEVRVPSHLDGLDGLIIPGGESTTMSIFLNKNNFKQKLRSMIEGVNGRRTIVWGTCAGQILLSNTVLCQKTGSQQMIGGVDITTSRNTYGRQCESFESEISTHHEDLQQDGVSVCRGIFIRAPGVVSIDDSSVITLATIGDENTGNKRIVAVQQGNIMTTSFHPELTEDTRWHTFFLDQILKLRTTSQSCARSNENII
ncbi:unnamed protein product [Owenia fusiformis]|uniref:glutaminase n=1 Tax=Owenia fusiformis TaxID=6347 RepID=A0A8J1XJT3_OWEFU|nr:unnamed protein product [Owenia fusiformis]